MSTKTVSFRGVKYRQSWLDYWNLPAGRQSAGSTAAAAAVDAADPAGGHSAGRHSADWREQRFFHNVLPMLRREGFYVHHKNDRGGETYCGIARTYWPNWIGWEVVDAYKRKIGRALRRNERIEDPLLPLYILDFYREHFWKPIYGDDLVNDSLVDLLFDSHVLLGKRAIKYLQIAINEVGGEPRIRVDWALGPKTLARLHQLNGEQVFNRLKALRRARHQWVAANVPGQDDFIDGWLARVDKFSYKSTPQSGCSCRECHCSNNLFS